MISLLKFILSIQLKRSKTNKTISGFTLIELLVAMVLAVLIITPLMAFMINILDGDRKEQAKATSEQEIQAALDYIARDLQQAVYIYDADGVTRNTNTTVSSSGIADQIPPAKSASSCSPTSSTNLNVCTPILVFWKRQLIADSVGISANTQTSATNTDDGFAYSLVAYYLITNPNPPANSPWSQEARIGRFELRGPVNATNANATGSASDTGFNPPPLNKSGASLKEKMNQWQTALGASANYSTGNQVVTLVDYISTTAPNSTPCSSPNLVGSQTSGFFACVDATQILAQVYIRGNALARVQNNNLAYNVNTKSYFPNASIRVQGRGFLFTK